MNQTIETTLLAPFEIWEVPFDNAMIKFHKPLVLTPMWMKSTWIPEDSDEPEENEYLQVVDPELAIDVHGTNREELLEAVYFAIFMAWKHFVQVSDDRLLPATKKIQQNYLALAEVVDGYHAKRA